MVISFSNPEEVNIIYFPNLCLKLNSLVLDKRNVGNVYFIIAFLNFLFSEMDRDNLFRKTDLKFLKNAL